MRGHEVEYQVYGDDLQFVEVVLDPAESVNAPMGRGAARGEGSAVGETSTMFKR